MAVQDGALGSQLDDDTDEDPTLWSIATSLDSEEKRIEEGVQRLPTGFRLLDEALGGGLVIPSVNVLGAAPKSGKSTFAQSVAVQHVKAGGVAYYLDLENGRRRFLRQLLCREAHVAPKVVAAALRACRAGDLSERETVERWKAAKAWMRRDLGGLYVDFRPPENLERRIAKMRKVAGKRVLLVVIDSLQKLPGDLKERRAATDDWMRLFARLRNDFEVVFLVISELTRSYRGGYEAHEAAFKESGEIEYTADLAMTMTRPSASNGDQPVSTLRIELVRDCDDDPRGNVASYTPVFPHYGIEEIEPVLIASGRKTKSSGPRPARSNAAAEFLRTCLRNGPVGSSTVIEAGGRAGHKRATIQRAATLLGVEKKGSGWRLP
jgi:replicative DNA helicase